VETQKTDPGVQNTDGVGREKTDPMFREENTRERERNRYRVPEGGGKRTEQRQTDHDTRSKQFKKVHMQTKDSEVHKVQMQKGLRDLLQETDRKRPTERGEMLMELRRGSAEAFKAPARLPECRGVPKRLGFADLRFTPSKKAFRRSPELRQGSPETDGAPARVAGGRRSSGEGRRRLEAAACAREGGVAATTGEVAGCCYCVMLFAVASATKRMKMLL
jgi:hypothetical protein